MKEFLIYMSSSLIVLIFIYITIRIVSKGVFESYYETKKKYCKPKNNKQQQKKGDL